MARASTLPVTVPITTVPAELCAVQESSLTSHRCEYSHFVSYQKALIHLLNECLLSVCNVPGTAIGAENTASEKAKKQAKQSKET